VETETPGFFHSGRSPRQGGRPLISVIAPVLDEAEAIGAFLAAYDAMLQNQPFDAELLFVDDGSTDATRQMLAEASRTRTDLGYVGLSRNFGKEAAMTAGLAHARGDAAVIVDVDLQDPLELIPIFVRYWQAGADMVYGVRTDRSRDAMLKRVTAGWFYNVFNRAADTRIPANAGDFRLLDRRVIEALQRLPERNRFMKGLYAWVGFQSVAVPYSRAPRLHGRSKFNGFKLWNFALDGVIGFSTALLKVWTYVGLLVALTATLYAGWIGVRTVFFGRDVPGYASLMVAILVLGSAHIVSIGMLGEYIGRLFIEAKQRPIYILDEVVEPSRRAPSDALSDQAAP
jgi:glycosyltransferase involved in cell wall biosynthesis